MKEIILTPEMIQQYNLQGAMAGEIASMDDMIKMGLVDQKTNLPLLPKRDQEAENIANESVEAVVNNPPQNKVTPLVDPNTMQRYFVNQNKQMLDLFAQSQQQQEPADPTSNLSKNQRMMLAFAGIRDAGMALQGKNSSTVSDLLGSFTKQADVDRKAAAALQTQQFLQGMTQFGPQGTGAMPEGMSNIDMLKARRDNILSQSFAIDPRYMPVVQSTLNELNRQIKELEQKSAKDEASATGARTVLDTVGSLVGAIEEDGNMITGPIGMILGTMPFTKAGEARLNIQTLKANLAFDALRGIKASGATLGAVSAPELALLEAKVANLDLNRGKDAVIASLKEIDRYYKQLIVNAYKISEDPTKLDAIFGGRPAWADGQQMDLQALEFTRTNVPQGELIVDRNGGNKVYRYIGGPRNKASSYEEVN
jgi:hypothetical protein